MGYGGGLCRLTSLFAQGVVYDSHCLHAFHRQVGVVRGPLVELSELEAAWLIHTCGVTTPEAVPRISGPQHQLVQRDWRSIGPLTLVNPLGILACPFVKDVSNIIIHCLVAVLQLINALNSECRLVRPGRESEVRAHSALVPEAETKVEESLELRHEYVDLLREQAVDDEVGEKLELDFEEGLQLDGPVG